MDSCAGMPRVAPGASAEDTGTAELWLEPVDPSSPGVFQDTEDDEDSAAEQNLEVEDVVLRSLVCKEEGVGHEILELAEEGSLSVC